MLRPGLGYSIIRVGLGIMMVLHGLPKLWGGPDAWQSLGGALPFLPDWAQLVAGFAAMLAELLGGICLATGFFFRWACLLLMATMAVAFTTKFGKFDGLLDFAQVAGWPLELFLVFLGLFLAGPGKGAKP